MNRVKTIVAVILAAVQAETAPAQTADTEAVDRLTARALKHLTTMTRFAYKAGTYGDIEFGKNYGYKTVEGYFGETTGVVRVTEVRTDLKTEEKFGKWVDGDQLIHTRKGDSGGTVIFRHHVPWASESDATHFAGFFGNINLGYFFLPTSAEKYGRSRSPDSLPYQEQGSNQPVNTVTEETHRGRPCFKVVVLPQGGKYATDYYIDKHHGMVLTKRQKGMLHIPKGSRSATVLNVEQLTEVSYGPPTENGLPFPTAVKGWYVWPTGRREPMTDVEFTEFRRYTPTADELDFQKQFGIPLPSLPPKPGVLAKAGGSRATRWLAGGFGIAVIAALVVYVRRRSRHVVS